MTYHYGILEYALPTVPVEQYTTRALERLRAVQAVAPATLPIFLSANSVLTLSGVRAYDAYHTFYDVYDQAQIEAVTTALQGLGLNLLFTDKKVEPDSDQSTDFEMLNQGAYNSIWHSYRLPRQIDNPSAIPAAVTEDEVGFIAWSYLLESDLRDLMYDNVLPKQWLQYYLATHDLRFGMLLGYPAKAIEWNIYSGADVENDKDPGDPEVQATVAHDEAYFAASPVYSYGKSLNEDPQIVAHQKLWSDILTAVYESNWHKTLQADPAFQAKVEQISQADAK